MFWRFARFFVPLQTHFPNMAENIYPIYDKMLSRAEREAQLHQHGMMIWFTGLSGSGKTTVALGVERELHQRGILCRILDATASIPILASLRKTAGRTFVALPRLVSCLLKQALSL